MKKAIVIILILAAVVGVGFLVLWNVSGWKGPLSKNEPKRIGIQPFGNIAQAEIDSVQTAIAAMFDLEVVLLPNKALPKIAFTEVRKPRYRADTLVHWLKANRPDSIAIIVGLTNKDISITKYDATKRAIKSPEWKYKDFGIFGLGSVGGYSCVVSSNRLHNKVSSKKFFTRLTRIACHEVGHVLGLHHCPSKKCLMNDANESIKTIDKSTGELCNDCKRQIQ